MPEKRLKSPLAQAVVPVAAGIAFFAVVGLVLWGIAHVASQGARSGLQVRLGADEFNLGDAADRADEIAQRGPVLYPGLLAAGQGYIVVNHVGTNPTEGWHAFAAVVPGEAARCTVQWQASSLNFLDPCSGATFGPDGAGLPQLPVSISDAGEVVVDLTPGGKPGQGPSTAATTTTTTTTTIPIRGSQPPTTSG